MNISNVIATRASTYFQESIVQDMGSQVKRILSAACLAFIFLAGCYFVLRKHINAIVLKPEEQKELTNTPVEGTPKREKKGRNHSPSPFRRSSSDAQLETPLNKTLKSAKKVAFLKRSSSLSDSMQETSPLRRMGSRDSSPSDKARKPIRVNLARQSLTVEMIENVDANVGELILDRCNPANAQELFKKLPENLRKLSLKGWSSLEDDALAFLPSRLKRLDLTGCTSLTNHAVELLSKKCPDLKILILAGCIQLTDEVASFLPTKVIELSLARCNQISDAIVPALPQGLEILNFDELAKLEGKTFDHLPDRLKELSIELCENIVISEEAKIKLAKQLKKINVKGCSDALAIQIANEFPRNDVTIVIGRSAMKKRPENAQQGV